MGVPSHEEDASASGEDRLIARYFRPLAKDPGAFALLDDAAAITPPADCDIVLKTDSIIGGIHFLTNDPPELIGKKALRVNLSDLAAKAARPIGFLLALALPEEIGNEWLAVFAQGLAADAELFSCPLFGGDTDRTTGPIAITIAAIGAVPHGKMLRRFGAQPGDRVVVTGTVGDAALGLLLRRDVGTAARWGLSQAQRDELEARYLLPQPRSSIAELLGRYASAAMDVSDGLVGDLTKLCRVSGVTADIEVGRVPLSPPARAVLMRDPAVMETILTGGDDYEVLASVPQANMAALRDEAAARGIPVTEIGLVAAGNVGARVLDPSGRPVAFARPSFSHF
jgi:thiamine-monophosphate kinase